MQNPFDVFDVFDVFGPANMSKNPFDDYVNMGIIPCVYVDPFRASANHEQFEEKPTEEKPVAEKTAEEMEQVSQDGALAKSLQEEEHLLVTQESHDVLQQEWRLVTHPASKSRKKVQSGAPTPSPPDVNEPPPSPPVVNEPTMTPSQNSVKTRFVKGDFYLEDKKIIPEDIMNLALQSSSMTIAFTGPDGLAPNNSWFNLKWKFPNNYLTNLRIGYDRRWLTVGKLEYAGGNAKVDITFNYEGIPCTIKNATKFIEKINKISADTLSKIKDYQPQDPAERIILSAKDAPDEIKKPPCWYGKKCNNQSCRRKH